MSFVSAGSAESAGPGHPPFLTILLMPLTLSITEGIAFGLISYSVLKLVTGRLQVFLPYFSNDQ